jgi:hypothetical protein
MAAASPEVETVAVPADARNPSPTAVRPHGAAPNAASNDVPAPDLTVVGTSTGATGAFAVLRRRGSPQFIQVRVGDSVDRMVVAAIEFDRIVLVSQSASGESAPTPRRLEVATNSQTDESGSALPPAASEQPKPPLFTEPEIVVAGH